MNHRFHRGEKGNEVVYNVLPESVNIQTDVIQMKVTRQDRSENLAVEIYFIADNIYRMKIMPTETARQRYEIPVGDVLVSELKGDR